MEANFISSSNVGRTNWIIKLIENSTFSYNFKRTQTNLLIEDRLKESEVERLELKLIHNQIDPIEAGNKYTQTDIHKKLNKMGL